VWFTTPAYVFPRLLVFTTLAIVHHTCRCVPHLLIFTTLADVFHACCCSQHSLMFSSHLLVLLYSLMFLFLPVLYPGDF
jgi:hypothetical protein